MRQEFIKPTRLRHDDIVAVVSPSWGGPSRFPHVYELGLKALESEFGLRVKEYPTARADADFLYDNPQKRAEDLNNAFADKEVKAIIASIGGDDSIRILPHLDSKVVRSNPKIVMGYSDTTTLLAYCNRLGLVSFHGPSVMAGLSQIGSLSPSFTSHVKEMLFQPKTTYEYHPYDSYSDGYPEWAEEDNLGKVNTPRSNPGWSWLQGKSIVRGQLFGGNIEVLEWLRGTEYWPEPDFWRGKVLFLETSEEKPHRAYVRRWLRTFGIQGLLDKVVGILFGRARDYSDEEKKALDQNIVAVTAEFHRSDMPILTGMDFGHTDPQFILPLGVNAEVDCKDKHFRLLEDPVQ
jgi:muramoyltetrapeptide carboxypeptidase LdcA involved in peptidoglycan recycling